MPCLGRLIGLEYYDPVSHMIHSGIIILASTNNLIANAFLRNPVLLGRIITKTHTDSGILTEAFYL